ncbi:hypothetical protein [Inquilinus limosus]|uniref:hypothetical protein n=1 Tax=Inquilinus limosus TaxID=171674 RepID=UPI001376E24E|nr:hypothetical protein [Inquilinus limosus]
MEIETAYTARDTALTPTVDLILMQGRAICQRVIAIQEKKPDEALGHVVVLERAR